MRRSKRVCGVAPMAATPANVIKDGAHYLLSVLESESSVPYSRFYDGEDDTHAALNKALGLEDDWYCAEVILDLAVSQLEEQGLVTTTPLDTFLADGESDYLIAITDAGKKWSTERYRLQFRDME